MLHIIHGSGLTSRFRPPEGTSIRFLSPLATIQCVHFVSVWCNAAFLAEKSSDVASVASHHPQHLPPTSYYQMTFNPLRDRQLQGYDASIGYQSKVDLHKHACRFHQEGVNMWIKPTVCVFNCTTFEVSF